MVEAFRGEARHARGGSRNMKARPIGLEEARSSGSELYSVVATAELDMPARTHHRVRGRARESENE